MTYQAPRNLDDALDILASSEARIIAGCTDYFPSLPAGRAKAPLLDVSRIEGLRGIDATPAGWRIGAATTWTDILKAPLPPVFDGLKQAAREVGSVQIQNRGTVAGNICNASPAADGVPPLLALDATVEITSQNATRSVALSEFITGVRATVLASGEIVTALDIPPQPDADTSAFLKLGSRTHLVISIAMVAVCVTLVGGRVAALRAAVGSCAPVARRLPDLEAAIKGCTATEIATMDFAALPVWSPLTPIDDVRGTATYRLEAVATLCQRAILQAMNQEISDGRA